MWALLLGVVRALRTERMASELLGLLAGATPTIRSVLRQGSRVAALAGRFVDTGALALAPIAGKPVVAYRLTVTRRGRRRFEDLSVASARLSDGTGVIEVALEEAVPTPDLEVEGRFTRAPAALEHRLKARYPDAAGWFADPDLAYHERAVGPDEEVLVVGGVQRRPRVRLDAWWVAKAEGKGGRAALGQLLFAKRRGARGRACVLLFGMVLTPLAASESGLVDFGAAQDELRSGVDDFLREVWPGREAPPP